MDSLAIVELKEILTNYKELLADIDAQTELEIVQEFEATHLTDA